MSDRRWRYEDDLSTDEDDLDGGDLSDRRRAGPPGDARPDPRRWLGEREPGEHVGRDELQVLSLLHTLAESIKAREGESSGMSLAPAWSLDVPASRPPRAVAGQSADESERVEEWPDHIGKYRVIGEPLGEGAQGVVFRVEHPNLRAPRVLKLAQHPMASGSAGRDGLVREGRTLDSCDHPNLIRVFDLDYFDGRPFIVMEDVQGLPLDQFVRHRRPLPGEAARLVAELADAVAHLNSRGIIHQDIKPANVLIGADGKPRLIDLGLARMTHSWLLEPTGSVAGTAAYTSPEQACGFEDRIGPRTDVFGLGAVLYFLLTGRPVYHSSSEYALLRQAARGDQLAPRVVNARVPRALERICLKALARDPDQRYRTADDLARVLRGYGRRVGIKATALASAALLVGLCGFAAFRSTATPRIASPIAGEAVPRIVSFRVEHFRGDKPPLSLGIIGESSWAVSFDDDVRVQASLDATPYSYLFAVSPNGCVELCDSTIGAGTRSEVRYPTGQEYHGLKDGLGWQTFVYPTGQEYHGLKDGLGWQTFVLLVSRKPLRAFDAWEEHTRREWKSDVIDTPDCVWLCDNGSYVAACTKTRGARREHPSAPPAFVEICDYFRRVDGVDAIKAVAFAVGPRR